MSSYTHKLADPPATEHRSPWDTIGDALKALRSQPNITRVELGEAIGAHRSGSRTVTGLWRWLIDNGFAVESGTRLIKRGNLPIIAVETISVAPAWAAHRPANPPAFVIERGYLDAVQGIVRPGNWRRVEMAGGKGGAA